MDSDSLAVVANVLKRMKEKIKNALIIVSLVLFFVCVGLTWWVCSQPVPDVDVDVENYAVHTNPEHPV